MATGIAQSSVYLEAYLEKDSKKFKIINKIAVIIFCFRSKFVLSETLPVNSEKVCQVDDKAYKVAIVDQIDGHTHYPKLPDIISCVCALCINKHYSLSWYRLSLNGRAIYIASHLYEKLLHDKWFYRQIDDEKTNLCKQFLS